MNNEPVAWMSADGKFNKKETWYFPIPLYTHPAKEYKSNQTLECSFDLVGFKPPAKTLTDDEIIEIAKNCGWETGDSWDDCVCCSKFDPINFAREVLRKAQEK